MYTSSSSLNYIIFKTNFAYEKYLVSLPPKFYTPFLIMIGTRNHHLPIETGGWHQIARNERTCHLCNAEIGDEYHYIMICKIRASFIPRYFYMRPNTFKFEQLMNTTNRKAHCSTIYYIFLMYHELYTNICFIYI